MYSRYKQYLGKLLFFLILIFEKINICRTHSSCGSGGLGHKGQFLCDLCHGATVSLREGFEQMNLMTQDALHVTVCRNLLLTFMAAVHDGKGLKALQNSNFTFTKGIPMWDIFMRRSEVFLQTTEACSA